MNEIEGVLQTVFCMFNRTAEVTQKLQTFLIESNDGRNKRASYFDALSKTKEFTSYFDFTAKIIL